MASSSQGDPLRKKGFGERLRDSFRKGKGREEEALNAEREAQQVPERSHPSPSEPQHHQPLYHTYSLGPPLSWNPQSELTVPVVTLARPDSDPYVNIAYSHAHTDSRRYRNTPEIAYGNHNTGSDRVTTRSRPVNQDYDGETTQNSRSDCSIGESTPQTSQNPQNSQKSGLGVTRINSRGRSNSASYLVPYIEGGSRNSSNGSIPISVDMSIGGGEFIMSPQGGSDIEGGLYGRGGPNEHHHNHGHHRTRSATLSSTSSPIHTEFSSPDHQGSAVKHPPNNLHRSNSLRKKLSKSFIDTADSLVDALEVAISRSQTEPNNPETNESKSPGPHQSGFSLFAHRKSLRRVQTQHDAPFASSSLPEFTFAGKLKPEDERGRSRFGDDNGNIEDNPDLRLGPVRGQGGRSHMWRSRSFRESRNQNTESAAKPEKEKFPGFLSNALTRHASVGAVGEGASNRRASNVASPNEWEPGTHSKHSSVHSLDAHPPAHRKSRDDIRRLGHRPSCPAPSTQNFGGVFGNGSWDKLTGLFRGSEREKDPAFANYDPQIQAVAQRNADLWEMVLDTRKQMGS